MRENSLINMLLVVAVVIVVSIWGIELYSQFNTPYDNTAWEQTIDELKDGGDLFVGYYSAMSERQ